MKTIDTKFFLARSCLCLIAILLCWLPILAAPQLKRTFTPIVVNDIPYFVKRSLGDVVFVRVYAMYCPGCRDDLPNMNQIAYGYSDYPITFLNIARDKEPDALRSLVDNNKIYFEPYWLRPCSQEELSAIIKRIGGNYPGTIPYTLILDRKGQVRSEFTGICSFEAYCKIINQLLQEGG
jgi:thiol-disulfide isomerase/thioredoxin